MRLLTAIGVTVLAIGMSASVAHAQAPPRLVNSLDFVLINQPVPTPINSQPQTRALRVERVADDRVRLTGEVEIHGGVWQIYADQVDIFTDESRLVATGNVVFISSDGRIAAERVEFDTEAETGTFYNVTVNGAAARP